MRRLSDLKDGAHISMRHSFYRAISTTYDQVEFVVIRPEAGRSGARRAGAARPNRTGGDPRTAHPRRTIAGRWTYTWTGAAPTGSPAGKSSPVPCGSGAVPLARARRDDEGERCELGRWR